MKRNNLFLIAVAGLALPVCAELLPGVWKINPAVRVTEPLVLDTTNISGKDYTVADLLGTPADIHAGKKATVSAADTVLPLKRAAKEGSLQTLVTRITPDSFVKGTLKVMCPSRFVLYVDGKEQGKSEKAAADGSVSAQLTMEPYSPHEIAVKVLTLSTDTVTPSVKLDWTSDAEFKDVKLTADADAKRRFNLDDTAFGERVSRESVSPDGNWLITTYSNQYDVDKTLWRSTLTNLRTGATITLPTMNYAWMPTSATLYASQKGEDGYDIYKYNPADMKQTLVARNVPEGSVIFNRKGDKFYYSVTDKQVKQEGPLKRALTAGSRSVSETEGHRVYEYDIEAGAARPLTYGGAAQVIDFEPGTDRVLMLSTKETQTRRPFFSSQLMLMDPQTMKVDTLVAETGFMNGALYSPDGKKLLIYGSGALFDGIGAKIGNEPIANDFDIQLFELDPSNGKVRPLSKDFDPSVKDAVWADNGLIYVLGEEGFDNNVYSLNPSNGKYTRLPLQIENIRAISVSDNGGKVAYWGQGADYAGIGRIYDTRKKQDTLVADPMAERLAEVDLSKSEHTPYTDADGTVIDGWLTYPPEFDASKKYPLIVYYYGGTSPTQKGISNPYSPQLFASRGYVVYTLNPSGTTGYGQEYAARHVNAWGKRTAKDIIDATQHLVDTHPFIDKDKIGCLGASYGGFMTQYLQTQTPMFAAAVSHAGISNVTSYWGEGWWGYSYNGVAAADSYPWNNPELFTQQGSLFNADKIHTPLLLLHGTADTNVPIGESVQLYNALKILDRPVEFVSVDGENHFISDYAKRRLWHSSIMAWFDLWLKGDKAWWHQLYPSSPYGK